MAKNGYDCNGALCCAVCCFGWFEFSGDVVETLALPCLARARSFRAKSVMRHVEQMVDGTEANPRLSPPIQIGSKNGKQLSHHTVIIYTRGSKTHHAG